jgi:hypothetical protein
LDIALRKNAKGFSAETADLLRAWLDPASLSAVAGTPVSCLVVSWASGLPEDAAQQQALKPLIDKGRQAGLDFAGAIEGKADRQAAIAAAQQAGLAAVLMDGDAPANAGIPVIPRCEHAHLAGTANSPILGISDGKWPGIPQDVNQAGRGRSRELRRKVGDLAGRCPARRPGREEAAGSGCLEQSRRHGGFLRAAQTGPEL